MRGPRSVVGGRLSRRGRAAGAARTRGNARSSVGARRRRVQQRKHTSSLSLLVSASFICRSSVGARRRRAREETHTSLAGVLVPERRHAREPGSVSTPPGWAAGWEGGGVQQPRMTRGASASLRLGPVARAAAWPAILSPGRRLLCQWPSHLPHVSTSSMGDL